MIWDENGDIFSGKSIYNRETISKQEHTISEYRCDGYCIFVPRLHYPGTSGRISNDSTVSPKL